MKVAFLGTGDIGIPSFKCLLESAEFEVVGLVTQPDRPAGRSMKLRPPAIKGVAAQHGVPVQQPVKLRRAEAHEQIADLGADLFIVAAYGQILSASTLALPQLGCINIHASLLPRHRGASPIQAAILAGDEHSGVTIMWMDEGLDTGDILLQRELALAPGETGGSLHDRLAEAAPSTLVAALDLIKAGGAPRLPQDPKLATYAPKISRADGQVNWQLEARSIVRQCLAYDPWPGSFTSTESGVRVKLFGASIAAGSGAPGTLLESSDSTLRVAAGQGAVDFAEVQIPGTRRLPFSDFLRGHPDALGRRFVRLASSS